MTIAGHVAQGLAEALCGLVIHQRKAPGAPFLIGMGPAVLDMKTLECTYNAPEYLIAHQVMVEMSQYYSLPNWGYAGTTDSQIPDEQAVFEAGLETYLSAMVGSNLNHDIGYMDFGRTGSMEMLVILDEIIDQARRFMRGISVNDEELALDAIESVGADGNHLIHPHTMKHMRRVQWQPKIISRMGYDRWHSTGRLTLMQRTRQRLREIIEHHKPSPVPEHQFKQIHEVIDSYSKAS
jgi:trimethylamine--corrinoid protein Co-methyltransferase